MVIPGAQSEAFSDFMTMQEAQRKKQDAIGNNGKKVRFSAMTIKSTKQIHSQRTILNLQFNMSYSSQHAQSWSSPNSLYLLFSICSHFIDQMLHCKITQSKMV